MTEAGFDDVRVSAREVYVDSSRPELVDGFTRKTFTAMIEGMREAAIAAGLIEPERFDEGVRGALPHGRGGRGLLYTFFKGVGRGPTRAVTI